MPGQNCLEDEKEVDLSRARAGDRGLIGFVFLFYLGLFMWSLVVEGQTEGDEQ